MCEQEANVDRKNGGPIVARSSVTFLVRLKQVEH